MNTTQTPPIEPTKATLSEATRLLFQVASRSHTLRDLFGIEVIEHGDVINKLRYLVRHRDYLFEHPTRKNELSFDPDIFAKRLTKVSDGERHMILFILNVWNPHYAPDKGWQFDLFKALGTLDSQNAESVARFIERPIWP